MTLLFIWVKVFNYFQNVITCELLTVICVFFERTEGRSLFVFIREHCFAKELLNISVFSLKFVMNLSLCNNGGMQGIFLLFKNVFNIDQ